MRRLLIILTAIAVLVCIVLAGCSQPMPPHLAVYRSHLDSKNPNKMVMDSEPLFTDADIREYHWKTQTILFTEEFLKKKISENLEKPEEYKLRNGGSWLLKTVSGDHFTVMVDGNLVYEGNFKASDYVSYQPPVVEICDTDGGIVIQYFGGTPVSVTENAPQKGDPFSGTIEILMESDGKDPRFDPRIQKALKKEQLHE